MRKLISVMTIFLTTSTVPISVVACSNNSCLNLDKVLTHKDLGAIDTSGMPIPTRTELDNAIVDKNQNIKINALKLTEPVNNTIEVSGDGITYKGKTTLKFTLKQQIPLNTIISEGTFLLKNVATEGKPLPNCQDIITTLKSLYLTTLNTNKINITNIKQTESCVTATLSSKDNTYSGTTTIRFDISRVIELNKVITNPNLGVILTQGEDINANALARALQKKYQTLDTNKITITNITNTSAIVDGNDPTVYPPGEPITLNYTVDKHLDFNTVLKDTNLGQIHIDAKTKKPTSQQIKIALTANGLNPKLNVIYLKIDQITTSSAVITSTDQTIYQGNPITVTYSLNKSTDLNDIILKANRDLGTFKLPDKTVPSSFDIEGKLIQYSLQWDKLSIDSITNTSAVINSKDLSVYTGSVTVTFKVDSSVTLTSVLTNRDLGTIKTNGIPYPSNNAVVNAITKNNNKLNSAYIKVDNITNNSATVTGDNTHYTGSVTVTFKVDNSTIINPISYQDSHDYSATSGGTSNSFDGKDQVILPNWTNYAKTWDDFTKAFPKLSFGNNADFHIWMNTCDDKELKGKDLNCDTNIITNDKTKQFFPLKIRYTYDHWWSPTWHANLDAYITIWHDDKNIYVNWHGSMEVSKICTRDSQFSINLPEADFHQ